MAKLKTVKHHTPGEVRYFSYFLHFPDGDEWVDQTPFVNDLQFVLANTRFMKDPTLPGHVGHDLANRGDAEWFDNNGVRHTVVIEKTVRNRRWGVRRK